jgi:hypothetical protein
MKGSDHFGEDNTEIHLKEAEYEMWTEFNSVRIHPAFCA